MHEIYKCVKVDKESGFCILFSESFYTSNGQSTKAMCVGFPWVNILDEGKWYSLGIFEVPSPSEQQEKINNLMDAMVNLLKV